MVAHLQLQQPNLNITDKDKLCVKIAGLLHDVGHGPFSHVFDGTFPDQLRKHLQRHPEISYGMVDDLPDKETRKHETTSLRMIEYLLRYLGLAIDEANLDEPLQQIGDGIENTSLRVYSSQDDYNNDHSKQPSEEVILTSRDWIFVQELITATPYQFKNKKNALRYKADSKDATGYVGRPHHHKEFLYDIVCNRHSGLDVDKCDYFVRDGRRVFEGGTFAIRRLIEEALVAVGTCPRPEECFACSKDNPGKHYMICYPFKMAEQGVAFFRNRFEMHSQVYTHKATQAATYMVADILTKADPYFRFRGYPNVPISRAMLYPEVFLQLRDSIIDLIGNDPCPQLEEAREIIQRLRARKLYKCVHSHKFNIQEAVGKKVWAKDVRDIEREIFEVRGVHSGTDPIELDDIIVEKRDIHMGDKSENPLLRMRFLDKRLWPNIRNPNLDELPEAKKIVDEADFSAHVPKSSRECSIRVFCRSACPNKCELLHHMFLNWVSQCEQQLSDDVDDPSALHTNDEDEGEGPVALTQEEPMSVTPAHFDDGWSPIPMRKSNARKSLGFDQTKLY